MLLLVRNHPQYFAQIAVAYQRSLAQLAFAFLVFRRQDVAQVRMSPLHFACRGLLEALGCAFVRVQFLWSLFWNLKRDSRPDSIRLKSATDAKPDSELPRLRPALAAFRSPVPAFLAPASLSPAPAFFPASLSAWLLFLFLSRAPPPSSSEPGWRAACCLPAADGIPQYSALPRP